MNNLSGVDTQVIGGGLGGFGGGMYGAALPLVGNLGVGSCGGGYGGGFGGMGILELLIVASLFGGRGGLFGGNNGGCCDNKCCGQTNFTAFDSLQNQLNTITSTINSNKLDCKLDHIDHEICETNHHIDKCCCKIEEDIKDNLYAMTTQFGAVINNADKCCCKIVDTIKDGNASILAYLNAEKMGALIAENAKKDLIISQDRQNDIILSKVAHLIKGDKPQPVFVVDKCYC